MMVRMITIGNVMNTMMNMVMVMLTLLLGCR